MDTQRKQVILEKLAMEDYTVRQGAGWMEAAKGMGAGDWRALQKQFGVLRAGDRFRQNDGGAYERARGEQQFAAYKPGAPAAAPAAVARPAGAPISSAMAQDYAYAHGRPMATAGGVETRQAPVLAARQAQAVRTGVAQGGAPAGAAPNFQALTPAPSVVRPSVATGGM